MRRGRTAPSDHRFYFRMSSEKLSFASFTEEATTRVLQMLECSWYIWGGGGGIVPSGAFEQGTVKRLCFHLRPAGVS